ncbi:Single-stranded DNA-binding protein 3 [Varanus komodoensis]|nr:Single-stranded DNA-binding protein 3 [Varanus komodoensis]
MFAKGKGSAVPSDGQAREKLALYVYEYLLHVGAQKSAQTFLSEIRWEKNITLGEPPGFLHSWWCVFWDLYCAAPERRDTCEHSSEAKAFHDYGSKGCICIIYFIIYLLKHFYAAPFAEASGRLTT